MLFVAAVLFTIIWWTKEKHGSNWLPMLIALLLICVATAYFAFRGTRRALAALLRSRDKS